MPTPANALDITAAGYVKFDGTNSFSGVSTVPIADGGTNASSFTQSNGIVTYNGTRLINYAGPQISSGGVLTNTTQPMLSAFVGVSQTNVTGDGTDFDVIFDTIVDQNGSNYDNTTGKFTCPVTGFYYIDYTVTFTDITSSMDDGVAQILSNAGTILHRSWNAAAFKTAGNEATISGCLITKRNATETLYINIGISNGTKTASTKAESFGPFCYLSIYLIG